MQIETVEVEPRPMLYVTRRSAMDSPTIGQAMAEMFTTLGQFIGDKHVPVAGPPFAVYRDHANGTMAMDLGFPVPAAAAAMASGDVKAGTTPGGKAMRLVHVGPYDRLRDTYAEIEDHLRKNGLPMPEKSWEVYLNEPGTVPGDELRTEIYVPIAG